MAVVGLVVVPVLYVLSTGPMAWLVDRFPALEFVGYVYLPLMFLEDAFPPVGRALQWYVDLWR